MTENSKEKKAALENELLLLEIENKKLDNSKKVEEINDLKKSLFERQKPTIISIVISGIVVIGTMWFGFRDKNASVKLEAASLENKKYEINKSLDSLLLKSDVVSYELREKKELIVELNDSVYYLNDALYYLNDSLYSMNYTLNEYLNRNSELKGKVEEEIENRNYKEYELAIELTKKYPNPSYVSDLTIQKGLLNPKYSYKIAYKIYSEFVNQDTNVSMKAYGLRTLALYYDDSYQEDWLNYLDYLIYRYKMDFDNSFPLDIVKTYSYNIKKYHLGNKIVQHTVNGLEGKFSVQRMAEISFIFSNYLDDPIAFDKIPDSLLYQSVYLLNDNVYFAMDTSAVHVQTLFNLSSSLSRICYQPLIALQINNLYKMKFSKDFSIQEKTNAISNGTFHGLNYNKATKFNQLLDTLHISSLFKSSIDDSLFIETYNLYHLEWEVSGKKWLDKKLQYFKTHQSELRELIKNNNF